MKEEDWMELGKFCQLDEYQLHALRKTIVSSNTIKLGIRQALGEEGRTARRGYYLIEGTVHLTATLSNGHKVVLTQLGRGALLNLEALILGRNPYAIVAASSTVVCLVIEEKEALALATGIKQELESSRQFRLQEIEKRQKKLAEQIRRERMEETINKLTLPSLQLNNGLKRSTPSPLFQQLTKVSTHSKLPESRYNLPEPRSSQPSPSLQIQRTQASSQRLISHFHEVKDKLVQKKLQRLKSQRSMSLQELKEGHSKEYDLTRNERLFKQQLKNIVKRKLMFQRKHFQILKRFGQQEQTPPLVSKPREEDQNPIDNYFNL